MRPEGCQLQTPVTRDGEAAQEGAGLDHGGGLFSSDNCWGTGVNLFFLPHPHRWEVKKDQHLGSFLCRPRPGPLGPEAKTLVVSEAQGDPTKQWPLSHGPPSRPHRSPSTASLTSSSG